MTPSPAQSASGTDATLRPVRLLGRGGMGEVWLCRDEALGVGRAVKFLLPERAADPALRERFAVEARTLASLGDVPGVVRIHAAGEDTATGRLFFVMDAHLLSPEQVRAVCMRRLGIPAAAAETVIDSLHKAHAEFSKSKSHAESAESAEVPFTLQDALGTEADETARQLPERAVISLAREIAAALDSLHGHAPPIIHRDLKPSNLLFVADGRLLLADFGVAKTLDEARIVLTRSGVQPGTQRYAAPELLRGDLATPASDWYALGVIIYRALTSSFPEWGQVFPTRDGLRPFSARWEPLLRDLLAPDPPRRLADRAELERRLDTLERSLDRLPRKSPRRAKVAAVAAVAAMLVSVGVGVLAYRYAESSPAEGSHTETAETAESGFAADSHAETAESDAADVSRAETVKSESPGAEFQDSQVSADAAISAMNLPRVPETLESEAALVRERAMLLPAKMEALYGAYRRDGKVEPLQLRFLNVSMEEWEAWLERRLAEDSTDRKILPASPESGMKKESRP